MIVIVRVMDNSFLNSPSENRPTKAGIIVVIVTKNGHITENAQDKTSKEDISNLMKTD